MKPLAANLYLLTLAFWTGGMSMFTFIVTPAIFRSYSRDRAGEIVGTLFPGYFLTLLVLSGLAILFFLLKGGGFQNASSRASLILLILALAMNCYVFFKLHPDALRIKQQVVSFEKEAPDSPARSAFRRVHATSAVLNLLVLADGIALLVLSRNIPR
ncbi:MAG: DUF4149 domain-containing protein [Nitrospiraceae bacterium]|nr:DUF4149 domain-containing protein [Nitrospiraceae bacterium]